MMTGLARRADFEFEAVRVFYENRRESAAFIAVLAQNLSAFLLEFTGDLVNGVGNVAVVVDAGFIRRLHQLNGRRAGDAHQAEAIRSEERRVGKEGRSRWS